MNSRVSRSSLGILLLTYTLFSSGIIAQIPEKPYENSRFFRVDSVRIHCRIWNDTLSHPRGKVLLIHGFIGSTFSWRENNDTLTRSGYKLVAVDLPGFGYSDRSLRVNQSQTNRAHLLLHLLDEIDQNDTAGWNIAGHSMGGGTAEAMALMRPERIRSLTIVDGMVFIKNGNMQGAFVTLSKNKQYNKIFSSMIEEDIFTYNMIKRLFKKNYGYIPDSLVVEGYLQPLLIPGTAECVISVWSNSKEIIELKANGFDKIPILVIWGEKDKTINLSRGKRFVRNVPAATLKIIPDAYHDPMETHPGVFNDYLVGFLNQNN